MTGPSAWMGVPPVGGGGSYPAWRLDMPTIDTWYQIANTSSLNGTTPTLETVDAYNGFCQHPTRWYTFLNGGHGAMHNAVQMIDFAQDAPQWVLVNAGTDSSQYYPACGTNDDYYYCDGKPASRHTSYGGFYIGARNRLMSFPLSSYAVNANPVPSNHTDGYNLANDTYDAAGTWADPPAGMVTVSTSGVDSAAKHPTDEDVWVGGYGKWAVWRQATNSWTEFTPQNQPTGFNQNWQFKGSCIDEGRNVWVAWNGPKVNRINLTTFNAYHDPPTGAFSGSTDDYAPTIHDLDNDRYLQPKAGTLYAMDPTTFATVTVNTIPWPSTYPQRDIFSRMAYFEEFGGVMYLPQYTSNVYFMPTR